MRIAIYVVVSLIAIVGVIALVGFFVPVSHVASRSAEFSKPPDVVFALIADPGSYKGWWDGAEVKSEVVERVPPSKLVTKVVGETQFGGTWTFEITPTAAGSRLTITERGEIYNLVFRALARYVIGYTGTMDSYLQAAQKKLAA
jgi:hypothetical protein